MSFAVQSNSVQVAAYNAYKVGVKQGSAGYEKEFTVKYADSLKQEEATIKVGDYEARVNRKTTQSTVDDYIKKHPNEKAQIDRLLNPGLKVMEKYGRSDAEVEEMSMDEYKRYIYGILDKIPYDSSQLRDTQFIDITEKGWEQMKNDPKYEAWVVGYFKVDRSVKNPFANYPGVEPRIHTEHFGATIEEHIGQSYPQSMSKGTEKDSEDWWKKRQERYKQYMEESLEYAEKSRMDKQESMNRAWKSILAKGSSNTYFDFEVGMMSAAVQFFAMSSGSVAKNVK